jgi:hypothetical protein
VAQSKNYWATKSLSKWQMADYAGIVATPQYRPTKTLKIDFRVKTGPENIGGANLSGLA